jgi:cytochrome c oxidase accessory protein FixG
MVQFQKEQEDKDAFRDQLATIDKKGKRIWVYAKKPKGKLNRARNIVGYFLLAVFLAGPFLTINGQPLLLLNFIDREIVIFGIHFWPQDFHLFFLAMISLMVFIILFTVTYGRLFCGWACPQTIFLELIYRKIEYLIEGDAYYQKKLKSSPWNFNKIWRKSLKQVVFFLIALVITNFFILYILGPGGWVEWIKTAPGENLAGLAGMVIFAGIFDFIFAWFREQVCTIVCPYGRLQGVLLDRNSIVISYDYNRGEPKGTFFKSEDRKKAGKGDCINCTQCVQVCPTGIDIRNGTQLECINCANCIDACNAMMKNVGQEPGLIRYASEKMIAEKTKWRLNVRTIAYSAVLIILLSVVTIAMTSRTAIEATVLRAPGQLYQEQEDGKISNLYNVKLVNKTNEELPIKITLERPQGTIQIIGNEILVPGQSVGESVFFVILDVSVMKKDKTEIEIGVYSGDRLIDKDRVTFIGPNK